ncbi:MAG TPA: tannase/feruloyl esterase family alpha/beta hydrolase [Steroidobacteraceae bacterium]|nr:tannase/feruloyl esterase family alpha/beta hydrolase [Steroidobacteraceae bacterium]
MKSQEAGAVVLLRVITVLSVLALPPAFAKGGDSAVSCTSLTSVKIFRDTTITTARMIGADTKTQTPAFCEVTGVVTPARNSHITVVYRLPESWNGKLVGLENVRQATGPKAPALDASLRLFLLSGVYHCRGGPGADGFDSLAALDRWVESGRAPDDMIATREDGKLSRPLCQYPTLARYKGSGDPAAASSFECR